jgi:uncharacterized lipoprotein YmbA
MHSMRIRYLLALWAVLLLTACPRVFRDEEPLRHYTLGAIVPEALAVANGGLAGLAIGLRQPRLADYLTAQFIAVRPHPNQVRLTRHHRWGGSLDREIGRALAEYLAARAPFDRVDLVPWPPRAVYDYIIELEVLRFDAVLPGGRDSRLGQAHLRANWDIIRARDAEVVASGTTDLRQPGWPVDDYPALVGLLDDALRALADELVTQLQAQPARASG